LPVPSPGKGLGVGLAIPPRKTKSCYKTTKKTDFNTIGFKKTLLEEGI